MRDEIKIRAESKVRSILAENIPKDERIEYANRFLLNGYSSYYYENRWAFAMLIDKGYFDIKELIEFFGGKGLSKELPNEYDLPKEVEEEMKRSPNEYREFMIARYRAKEDYRGFVLASSVVARIKPGHEVEAFEFFSQNNFGTLKNLVIEYNFFDAKQIIGELGLGKVLALMPAEMYRYLPDEWIETIATNPLLAKNISKMTPSARKELIKELPAELVLSDEFMGELLKDKTNFDLLPKSIASNKDVKIMFDRGGQMRDGLDEEWRDKNGKLVKFFSLYGGFELKEKQDYLTIYEKYLEEKLSLEKFCQKYRIEPVSGFNEMLDRIIDESYSQGEKIEDTKKAVSERFLAKRRSILGKIITGELSFDEFLNKNYSRSFTFGGFVGICNCDEANAFCKKIIEHYSSKECFEYTVNEIQFLEPEKNIAYDQFKLDIASMLSLPKDKAYYPLLRKMMGNLHIATSKFSRDDLRNVAFIKNGIAYQIDDSVIDQALYYAQKNNIWQSKSAIKQIAKMVAFGEIDVKKETEETKTEMKESLLELLGEKKSIEDYLETVSGKSEKK